MLGTLTGLRKTRLLPAPARDRDTSCHGRTVAAPVQRRTQDAHAPLRTNDHPRSQPRGAYRPAVTRPVPQGRDRGRRQGREGRHLGQAPPRLPDPEEVGRLLRGGGPDGGAGRRARARPPAQPERDHPAHQGHAAREPLNPDVFSHQQNPLASWSTPMAAGDTQITIAGNLVDDPELRFTPAGQPVARFRVASTPRFRDNSTGEWKDGDSLFLTCNVWRQAAENVAESLTRGMRVIVSGRLRQRSYETKEGEKRTVYEVEVDDVGPSLRNASAKVNRVARSGAGDGGYGGGQRSYGGRPSGGQREQGGYGGGEPDPWASDSPGGGGGYSDEPPF